MKMKKELCLPTETFLSLTRRLEEQQQALDEAQARMDEASKAKSEHEKEKRQWEKFHYAVSTSRDALAREARADQVLAHALLAVEVSLAAISERAEWYSEESSRLHAQYLAASAESHKVGAEVTLIETILSRAFCEGAVEGMPVED